MKRALAFLAAMSIVILVRPTQSAAVTEDVAAVSVEPAIALVNDPVTFTSTNPCTVACSLTWRRPDLGIPRFGGVIVGRGEQITQTFAEPGVYLLVLDLAETCTGTPRLVCHSFADASVEIVVGPIVPPTNTTTTTTAATTTTTTTTTINPITTTTTTGVDPTTTTTTTTTTTATTGVDPTTTTANPPTTTTKVVPTTTTITEPDEERHREGHDSESCVRPNEDDELRTFEHCAVG